MSAIGIDGVHKVIGYFCDLCGKECEGDKEELNALGCTYPGCEAEASVYHQDCIEKYLKSIRCEKNRKTGYHCPRGSGRNSKYSDAPCPGRVTKSHPIHIRNEQAKKRQKSKAADVVPAFTRPVKGKPKAAVASAKPKAPAPKATGVKIKNLRQEAPIKPLPIAKAPDAKPKEVPTAASAAMDKDQVKDAVYKAKLEIGLKVTPPVKGPRPAAAPAAAVQLNSDRHTFREDESTKGARPLRNAPGQPAVSAWHGNNSAHPPIVRTPSPAQAVSAAESPQSGPLTSPSQTDRGSQTQRRRLQQQERTPVKQTGKQTRISIAEPVQAAASPITPNAIKAFQPKQADCDTPLHPAADSHSLVPEDFSDSGYDGQSICSDDDKVSHALFAMDHSSESDLDKPAAAFSIGAETAHSSTGQEPAGAKTTLSSTASALSAISSHGCDSNSDLEEQLASDQLNSEFLQAIAWQKALGHAAEYQKLGYSQVQSIAAVNKWGDDMQGALAWLVQSNLDVMQGALHDELPTIDVSEELHYLWSCQQVFSPSKAVLQQIVIDAQGSLPTAVSMLLEWAQPSQARNRAACQEVWSTCNNPRQRSRQGVAPASNGSDGSSARAVASCKFSQGWQQQQTQLLNEAMQGAGEAPAHSRGEQQA
ncbi:hypothetical protein WJX77_007634 [Trebouxia sp. C0004]